MVREKKLEDKTVFICDVCGLGYSDWQTAKKCEEWCKKTGTCSIEVTKKAVYFPNSFEKQNSVRRH